MNVSSLSIKSKDFDANQTGNKFLSSLRVKKQKLNVTLNKRRRVIPNKNAQGQQ